MFISEYHLVSLKVFFSHFHIHIEEKSCGIFRKITSIYFFSILYIKYEVYFKKKVKLQNIKK